MKIDFIAHHEIQFQSCRGVYSILSKKYECKALIGQASIPSGAEIAVMLDHGHFQPNVNKKNYRFLIYMSHDLADIEIYQQEKSFIKHYDLLLVPGQMHYQAAKRLYGSKPVFPVGWPKLDEVAAVNVENENKKNTIIYAPTFIENREWEDLLPILVETGYKIFVKNHIYYDYESAVAPPKGMEKEYHRSIESLIDMEKFLAGSNFQNVEYINRRSNLCDLFPDAGVLITDSSSASIEFLSFGLAIESGRFPDPSKPAQAQSALICDQVKFLPLDELSRILKDKAKFSAMLSKHSSLLPDGKNPFIYQPPVKSSIYSASLIDMFLTQWSERYDLRFSSPGLLKRIFR